VLCLLSKRGWDHSRSVNVALASSGSPGASGNVNCPSRLTAALSEAQITILEIHMVISVP
jgi:hypothetical protein